MSEVVQCEIKDGVALLTLNRPERLNAWTGEMERAYFALLEECADDVVALADELGIDTFIPVGFSMGSLVAQLVWRRHPDRTEGLVLCAGAELDASFAAL